MKTMLRINQPLTVDLRTRQAKYSNPVLRDWLVTQAWAWDPSESRPSDDALVVLVEDRIWVVLRRGDEVTTHFVPGLLSALAAAGEDLRNYEVA